MRLQDLRRRLTATAVGAATVALVAALAAPGPAGAATAEELRVLELSNQVRTSVGSRPFVLDEALSVTARRWASTVAAAGRISHNPDLPVSTSGPAAIAENVGMGPGIQAVHDVLVASPGHYANLVNPIVDRVGIGVAWSGGLVYVVENFLIVRGSTAPTTPPSAVRPTAPGPAPLPPPAAPAKAPVTALPTTPAPATTVPVPVPDRTVTGPLPGPAPSVWLTLSFDVLRVWDRTSGGGRATR